MKKNKYDERHQKLVDLCFGLVLTSHDKIYKKGFGKMSQEELAEWVRKQLELCGFPTSPCGMCWGVLQNE